MAITNVGQLKALLTTFLGGRADLNVTIPDLITLGEQLLNAQLRLRMFTTTVPLTGTPGSRSIPLPADFLEPDSIFLTTFGVQTELTPFVAGDRELGTVATIPRAWCINQSNIDLDVPCDQAHTFLFRYRQKFTLDQSNDNNTNWLMTNYGIAYVYASLCQVAALTLDGQQLGGYKALLTEILDSIAQVEAKSVSVGKLAVDDALVTSRGFNIFSGD